jgi:hypothetical protein
MIYRPSNPLSIVLFLVSLLIEGIFWVVNWLVTQCQRLIGKFKAGRHPWQPADLLMK